MRDAEAAVLLQRGLLEFHAADVRHAGAFAEMAGELVVLGWRADGVHLDTAVVEVANPALHPQAAGDILHEVAVPHALHAAVYEVSASDLH